jgi:hypothetical protein
VAKLLRPYIPLPIRITVLSRQFGLGVVCRKGGIRRSLDSALKFCFEDQPFHLDHDPALQNRKKIYRKGVHVEYDPPANHPDFLIYRTKQDHQIKTNVRGDGAQYSDRALAARERRRKKPRKKYNWPKGRKIARRAK